MTTLELFPRPDNDHYELLKHFDVNCAPLGEIWVPAGFHYDGASIPAAAWQAIYTPFAPDVMRAAVVHDWLYHAHEDGDGEARRRTVDDVFFELLKMDNVSSFKRGVMWSAVRNFGEPYWENDNATKDAIRALRQRHQADPNFAKFRFPSWA